MKQQYKTAKSFWYGQARLLSADEELEVVKVLHKGKKFFKIPDSDLSEKELLKKKESIEAVNKLVEAYAPLIEKIAREHYSQTDSTYVTYEDFLAEAMIIALQCARNFDPFKGRSIKRFSSYVSNAISSSLLRVNYKTKTPLSTPSDKIAEARKWSHPFFDMQNKGIKVDDAVISKISGVNMTQVEVSNILDSYASQTIDDIDHPHVVDYVNFSVVDEQKERIIAAIEKIYPDKSEVILAVMGLGEDNSAIFSAFILSTSIEDLDKKEASIILEELPTLLSHPINRFRLQTAISTKKIE